MKPRYELKYVVRVESIPIIQAALRDVMDPDPNARNGGYHVNSLYFDRPGLDSYFDKLDGQSIRRKLRIRWYGEPAPGHEERTVYYEVKQRWGSLIHKDRLKIKLTGDEIETGWLALLPSKDGEPLGHDDVPDALVRHHFSQGGLQPYCLVGYHRRPYVCRIDPTLRVTFDTGLTAGSPLADGGNRGGEKSGQRFFLPDELCILEIKFHWAMPLWLTELCQEHRLESRRYSKYASCLENLYPMIARRSVRQAAFQ